MPPGEQTNRPTARPRPSVDDVASLAGVSLGTVSNVLNHPDKVAAATRERVERAMVMLGYVPNTAARSLKFGSTRSIGLIVSDLSNSLFVDIARGAETGAEHGGLTLLIANSDARIERESNYLAMFAQARVTGVLMTLNDAAHFAAVARRAPAGIPLVLLNFSAPVSQYCSVDVDNALGRLRRDQAPDRDRVAASSPSSEARPSCNRSSTAARASTRPWASTRTSSPR